MESRKAGCPVPDRRESIFAGGLLGDGRHRWRIDEQKRGRGVVTRQRQNTAVRAQRRAGNNPLVGAEISNPHRAPIGSWHIVRRVDGNHFLRTPVVFLEL